jgi:hypothetical protein
VVVRIQKWCTFLLFIFSINVLLAQVDSNKTHGTIKISKPTSDSIYMKATVTFYEFQKGNKKSTSVTYPLLKSITIPKPQSLKNKDTIHDYSTYFRKNIEIKSGELENKISDTVRIQIKVLDNGMPYYKDLTPLMVLNGVPAYYDAKENAYKLDDIHYKCLKVLKNIENWSPAYVEMQVKGKFKNTTVIKLKKEKLAATGILTIVFSSVPLND